MPQGPWLDTHRALEKGLAVVDYFYIDRSKPKQSLSADQSKRMVLNERGPDTDVMKERLYHNQLAVIATMHKKE